MQRLALKPFEARYRIAIFRDFDSAQPRAQDALLKTLEEPAPHAILILLANSLDPVLPTITSRSQVIHLRPTASLWSIKCCAKNMASRTKPRCCWRTSAAGGSAGRCARSTILTCSTSAIKRWRC